MAPTTTTFGTCDVADAAGVRESVLRSWVERRLIVMTVSDRDAAGRGQTRLFSFETALQVAIAAELDRLGFSPRRACAVARKFAHSGTPDRLPGQLFRDGKTLLIVYPDREHVACADDVASIFAARDLSASSVVIVDVNAIYRNTAARLGLPVDAAARN